MELVKTYTVSESWMNDTKGNPVAIINTLFSAQEKTAFNYNDYLIYIVEDNTSTNYKLEWMIATARDTYGCVKRIQSGNVQYRDVSINTSSWISSGATIKVYKGNVNNIQ